MVVTLPLDFRMLCVGFISHALAWFSSTVMQKCYCRRLLSNELASGIHSSQFSMITLVHRITSVDIPLEQNWHLLNMMMMVLSLSWSLVLILMGFINIAMPCCSADENGESWLDVTVYDIKLLARSPPCGSIMQLASSYQWNTKQLQLAVTSATPPKLKATSLALPVTIDSRCNRILPAVM